MTRKQKENISPIVSRNNSRANSPVRKAKTTTPLARPKALETSANLVRPTRLENSKSTPTSQFSSTNPSTISHARSLSSTPVNRDIMDSIVSKLDRSLQLNERLIDNFDTFTINQLQMTDKIKELEDTVGQLNEIIRAMQRTTIAPNANFSEV